MKTINDYLIQAGPSVSCVEHNDLKAWREEPDKLRCALVGLIRALESRDAGECPYCEVHEAVEAAEKILNKTGDRK